jgi:hypothetical protein
MSAVLAGIRLSTDITGITDADIAEWIGPRIETPVIDVNRPIARYAAIHATPNQLGYGDVLIRGNEYLTIRAIIGVRRVRVCNANDWQLQVYVSDPRGVWRLIGLTTALSYTLVAGPKWDAAQSGAGRVQICAGKAMWRGYVPVQEGEAA